MTRFLLPLFAFMVISGCALSQNARKQASYHYKMGLSYLGEQNYTGALVELTEAEKIDPDDPELLHRLGQAYFYKKKYDIAEQKYKKVLSLKPGFSQARNDLGVTYMEMKRWDDAIREFRIVTEDIFYPDQASAGINLALAYLGKGDHDQALVTARAIVAVNSDKPPARLTLGRIYFAAGRVNLAIDEYREALKLAPDFAVVHYYLGLAYLKADRNGDARSSFVEVVRIAPYTEIGQLAKEHIDSLK
jgi:type IV pilus assembly protein PilF